MSRCGAAECSIRHRTHAQRSRVHARQLPLARRRSASRRYWKEDIIEPEVEVSREGLITIRDEPGTGYACGEDLIEKLTVKKETIQT